ncbi:MAG: PKD domain-containing protein [Planctomycetales bacterium]|nr:PKD domain-containing protein [bacterium]UNM09957.1 MAG: PKD domain-containing protein [Planctomycetales bacterium]
MNRTSILIYALILLLAASMSGCGGQGTNLPQAPGTSTSDVLAPPINSNAGGSISDRDLLAMIERGESPFTFAQRAQQKMEQQLEQSNAALPGNLSGMALMPFGEAELPGNGQKITSALQDLDPTIVYADSGDITVNASSITINPGPGDLSWAMYQLNLPDGGYPLSLRLGIDTISGVGGPGQGFYVLVSNYTTKRWWMSDLFTTNGFKTIDLPTKVDLVPQNYLSPMNNLYVAILVYDGVTIEMNGLQQDTNTAPQALISETSNTYVRRTTEEFQFRSESEDGDNGIAGFSWDFNDDMVEDDNVIVVNHTYDTPGLHKVRLTVFDENGGSDTDTLYVWTYDTDDSVLPDEFMEALNEADPDPVPPPDIPLPELGFDETFEFFYSAANGGTEEWWEIPDTQDNMQWKNFTDLDGADNPYFDMRCWLPAYGSYYYDDHTEMLPFADSLANTISNWQDMQGVVQTGAWQHGIGVVNEGITLDVEDNDPLATAIKRLMNEYPDPLHDATFEQIQTEVAGVPDDFQRALARLVNAIRQAKPYHEAFMDPANSPLFADPQPDPDTWHEIFFNDSLGMAVSHDNGGPIRAYLPNNLNPKNGTNGIDYADLFQGASVLTNAMDEFHAFLDGWTPGASFDFQVRTSLGDIRVTGDGDDVINLPDWDGGMENGFYLLQVDIGGNDDYHCHAGGNAALANPIAICIDYAGNDEYFRLDDPDDVDRTVVPSNDDTHQQGSGRLGYGLLLDLEGNDSYDAVRLSQGCSNFGVGILCDLGGDDSYGVEAMGQGASLVGIGVLLDLDGMDNYACWSRAQGFSSFRGVGILSDRGGDDDTYTAESTGDPAKPEYGDGIGGVLNYAQGCARGKFPSGDASLPDGDPFVGSAGLGLLCEDGGTDSYSAGIFSQAVSFYEGTGMLLELGGDDNYAGDRFCGSIAILRAAAMLWDRSGADQYLYTGLGGCAVASDYAVTWLLDGSGDDTYEADSACMASGLKNSFSYMLDFDGNDSYTVLNTPIRPSLGSAYYDEFDDPFDGDGDRDLTPTLGLFVDIGPGADTYNLPEPMLDRDGNVLTVADDKIWVRAKHTVLEPGWHNYEYGVGADGNWMMP